MEEIWKDIKGYEGIYQISNLGRLKSFRGKKDGYILKQTNITGWYFTVNLKKGNKTRTKRIHRLVAETFIGEIPKGYQVHHIDGNKQNNRVDNLEIVSKAEHQNETMAKNSDFVKSMCHYNSFKRAKPVSQFTLDGEYLATFRNSVVAEVYTGVCARNILQVASQEPYNSKGSTRKQAGGYIWKYADKEVVYK